MFTLKVGKPNIGNKSSLIRWFFQTLTLIILLVFIFVVVMQLYTDPIKGLTKHSFGSDQSSMEGTKKPEGPCSKENVCPSNQISFSVQSGAANVVPPKICLNGELVLGTTLNNAGSGINIVVMNGKTGELLKSDHFNMYSGKVEPLIEFLKSIETGSVVLMAVFDEGSTNLNDEARGLIEGLGSSTIRALGYRDNWVFVGGKGVAEKSNFEKYIKSDSSKNKYDNWPEMAELEGCIPRFLE
ncbi:PREDICTED: protein FAM3C-like [Cyprinodon variegatus]|uniref:protein FAM3C-like n=1 Tax=Cyprinodon variegatus TaxID=28743 RepID=UPI0007429F91|nr:PREDICTED: protein FAM3C-like [Cyprinodon variegatus]